MIARHRLDLTGALLAVVGGLLAGLALTKLAVGDNQVKGMIVAVAAGAIVVAAAWPVVGLALLVALVPFEFQITVGGVLTGTDELLLIAFAAVLLLRVRLAAVPGWFRLGAALLVTGSALSIIHAADPGKALWGGVRWLLVSIVAAAAFTLLRERRDATERAIDIAIGAAVVVVLFAFAQRVGIYAVVGAPYDGVHVDSSFGYYTNYGGFVAAMSVLATGEALHAWTTGRTGRATVYGCALGFLLLGTAISLSRGGVVVVAIGWAMLIALNVRRGSVAVRALLLLVVFAGAGFAAIPHSTRTQLSQRVLQEKGSQNSDRTRFALQKEGHKAALSHPLGIGYGNFRKYLAANVANAYIGRSFFHCHQLPTQIALDAGWLGLLGLLVLLGMPFVRFFTRGPTVEGDVRATGFLAAIAGLVAQGMFDFLFVEVAMVAVLVFLVWGAATAMQSAPKLGSTA